MPCLHGNLRTFGCYIYEVGEYENWVNLPRSL